MSNYAKSQGNYHHVSFTSPQCSFVELLRSLSQRVHPFFWHVNGDADQEDALHKFLNIEHSDYLLLLENCGYGDNVTKVMTAELADQVGKEYCEFSEYTVRKSTARSQRNYIRLGCKLENTNEIAKKVKNQFKKGELTVFPKKLVHTCRLNKTELQQLTSLIQAPLLNAMVKNEAEVKQTVEAEAEVKQFTRIASTYPKWSQ